VTFTNMLNGRTSPEGVAYYVSPVLDRAGVPHAFSTRVGGVSPPPFDALNLGIAGGVEVRDDPDRVAQNYARLLRAIGCETRSRCAVHQVHAADVLRVRCDAEFVPGQCADALMTDDATKLLSITTADCVPVLFATTDGRTVAAAHAGWRGVVAGVVTNTIRAMPEVPLIAAIGPCIGFDAFEVGGEVLDAFAAHFGERVSSFSRRDADGKGHIDLRAAVRLQLIAAGIAPDRIDTADRCTFANADEFFSHRRDRGVTGRMASLIGPVA
jgi:polyphenol oxidase